MIASAIDHLRSAIAGRLTVDASDMAPFLTDWR